MNNFVNDKCIKVKFLDLIPFEDNGYLKYPLDYATISSIRIFNEYLERHFIHLHVIYDFCFDKIVIRMTRAQQNNFNDVLYGILDIICAHFECRRYMINDKTLEINGETYSMIFLATLLNHLFQPFESGTIFKENEIEIDRAIDYFCR